MAVQYRIPKEDKALRAKDYRDVPHGSDNGRQIDFGVVTWHILR